MIFQGLYFLNTSPIFEGSEIVCSKKTFPPSLLIYIYVGCVRRSSWCPTTLDTLLNNSYEVGTLLHCCTLVWWYKGRKLNGLVFRASLITKDNIAEYLQSQRRKKAILQVPEPFVIRLLKTSVRLKLKAEAIWSRTLTSEFLSGLRCKMTSKFSILTSDFFG